MAGHFIFAYVLAVLATNVRGQTCGTAVNQPCQATKIISSFVISYMAESTSETSQGVCSYLVRLSPEIVDGKANLSLLTRSGDGAQVTSVTEEITFTEKPDDVTLVFSNSPGTTYNVELPYADYSACFVTLFNSSLGCRLWVYDGAAADKVEACRAGHAQVCGESVYDGTACGGPGGSA